MNFLNYTFEAEEKEIDVLRPRLSNNEVINIMKIEIYAFLSIAFIACSVVTFPIYNYIFRRNRQEEQDLPKYAVIDHFNSCLAVMHYPIYILPILFVLHCIPSGLIQTTVKVICAMGLFFQYYTAIIIATSVNITLTFLAIQKIVIYFKPSLLDSVTPKGGLTVYKLVRIVAYGFFTITYDLVDTVFMSSYIFSSMTVLISAVFYATILRKEGKDCKVWESSTEKCILYHTMISAFTKILVLPVAESIWFFDDITSKIFYSILVVEYALFPIINQLSYFASNDSNKKQLIHLENRIMQLICFRRQAQPENIEVPSISNINYPYEEDASELENPGRISESNQVAVNMNFHNI
ncbi:unnamed protein product [Caenorhabditis bovis]|uniref:Uncharacterized protein n=1 Tax=Caenorhabditis bovis TaxID=2654633 RepID=A0A8S1F4B7_9PELO|nr:unnamed protein product [Caenorhabditis bovis]